MDFETHYTVEQQSFRAVARGWLEEYVPKGLDNPPDGSPLDPEAQEGFKEFRRKLGEQGWLAPSWPMEIGGAGLSSDFEVVLQEEMKRLNLPSMGDSRRWISAMMVWGTDDQKSRYVIPSLRGETITWQAFGEPDAGSDIASIKTQAIREGDEYIINGVKAFITGRFEPDYLLTLAVTDPTRPSHYNLGVFMVDAKLPGIVIKAQRLLSGSERFVYLNNIRVPDDCLIGTSFMGWEIAQTILQQERGEMAIRSPEPETIRSVAQYLKEERSQS